jgi:hypothetical protein
MGPLKWTTNELILVGDTGRMIMLLRFDLSEF